MGLFNWLLGKGNPAVQSQVSTRPTHTDIHATLADATRPFAGGKPGVSAAASAAVGSPAQRLEQRRSERNVRRELLFQVVRESMVRVGVLSSAFKFKVLALDQRGRTFLVMIDLSAEFAGETAKLAEIEALIAQSAKNRYELVVQAVYWRFYEAVSTGTARMGASSAPAPLFGMNSHTSSRPAPLSEVPYPVPARAPVAQPALAPVRTASSASATLATRPASAAKPVIARTRSPNREFWQGGTLIVSHPSPTKRPSSVPAKPGSAAYQRGGRALNRRAPVSPRGIERETYTSFPSTRRVFRHLPHSRR